MDNYFSNIKKGVKLCLDIKNYKVAILAKNALQALDILNIAHVEDAEYKHTLKFNKKKAVLEFDNGSTFHVLYNLSKDEWDKKTNKYDFYFSII